MPAQPTPNSFSLGALVLAAGLAQSCAQLAALAQGGLPALRMPGMPAPQPVSQRPYLDEALFAKDALAKAIELDSAGNRAEAARIVQDMLDREAEQLLPSDTDAQLWTTVRSRAHALLQARPALLQAYISEQSALASRQLAQGELALVERSRFLTPAGLEATLRIAQLDIEAARWHAAAIALESARTHPLAQEAGGPQQASVAQLSIAQLSGALDAALAQLPTRLASRPVSQNSFERFAASLPAATPSAPLRTLPFTPDPAANQGFRRARLPEQGENAAWIFPTRVGDRVLINDGAGIIAADAATLAPLWRTSGALEVAGRDEQVQFFSGDQVLDDGAFVATGQGVAVAALGRPRSGQRSGDARVVAVRIADGSELWSIDPRQLDPRLADAVVRGAPVVDGDVVVLGLRRPGLTRRISSVSLLGLDLFTGQMRYLRSVGSAGTQPWTRVQLRVDGVASEEGIVYRGDELGVFGAFEAHTGRPRWVRSFVLGKPQDPFDSGVGRMSIRAFEVASPVITSEHIYFIEPMDQSIVQLDKATGALLATRKADALAVPRYLLVHEGQLIVVGRSSVSAYATKDFATSEPVRLSGISQDGFTGRGVLAGDELLLPVGSGVLRVPLAALQPGATRAALPEPALAQAGESAEQAPANAGAATTDFAILPLSTSGNVLPIVDGSGGEGDLAHVLVADARALATHLSWERAKSQLLARAKASPADPAPTLTLLELSLRMGQAQDAPQYADTVLGLSRGLRGGPTRERVFRALSETLAVSRGAAGKSAPADRADQLPPAITDKALLLAMAQRLLPAADEPWQRAVAQLELALAHDGSAQGVEAIASAQRVLLDSTLAQVDFASLRLQSKQSSLPPRAHWGEPGRTLARDIATDMLWRLRESHGASAYAVYEEQARAALVDARAIAAGDARVRALVALSVRFPCAASSIDALELAGQSLAGQSLAGQSLAGQSLATEQRSAQPPTDAANAHARVASADARELLGEALTRALRTSKGTGALAGGTQASEARIASLLEKLATLSTAPTSQEPFARLLARVAREQPAIMLAGLPSPSAPSANASLPASPAPRVSIATLAQQWEQLASQRAQQHGGDAPALLPRLTELEPSQASLAADPLAPLRGDGLPQVLPGWDVREPLSRDASSSHDVFLAYRASTRTLAAFARSAFSPRVERLWSRENTPESVVVVHIGFGRTLLFVPPPSATQADAASRLEAIDNHSGLAQWQSPALASLRERDPQAQLLASKWTERMSTPLGGSVRPDDVIVLLTPQACLLVERGGFVASIARESGQVLWAAQSPLAIVYDADIALQAAQPNTQPNVLPSALPSALPTLEAGTQPVSASPAGALALSGALPQQTLTPEARTLGRMIAGACLVDSATGQPLTVLAGDEQVGEHARWIRALPSGGAVLATAEGVLRFEQRPASGEANVLWRTRVAAVSYSVAGSVVGESLFVLDTDLGLWRASLRTGQLGPGAELDTRERLSIPFETISLQGPQGSVLMHTSARGTLAHDASGKVLGVDALQPQGRIEPALLALTLQSDGTLGEPMLVTIESGAFRASPGFRNSVNASGPGSLPQGTLGPGRALFLRAPDMRLVGQTSVGLPSEPTSLALRDGLVLVGQEGGLVVLRALEE